MLCAASGCTTLYAATPPRLLPARPAPIAAQPAAACAAQQAAAPAECVDAWPDALLPVTGAAGLLSGHPDALDGWPAAATRPLCRRLLWLRLLQTSQLQRRQQTAGWPREATGWTLQPPHRRPTAACMSAASAAAVMPAASAAAAAAAALQSCLPALSAAVPGAPYSAAEEQ